MSLIKQLIPTSKKYFTPASHEVNWERVETLVHGPGAGVDKRSANSAVFACLTAIADAYYEPPLRVFKRDDDGNSDPVPGDPLQELLDNPTPNAELTIKEMLFWTAWAKHIDGNAYWLKVRAGNKDTGNVVQLWPISPTLMEPFTEKGSSDWISYYKYQIRPGVFVEIPVHNIVHFRMGIDDQDMRRGLSKLKALARQISTDEEADRFVDTLLKNYAVPGLVVIPTGQNTINEADAEKMTYKLSQKFGNDNRGNIAVMSRESQIEQFGFSPKDLDLSMLHRIPEERISAVMGVPAIIAGLGAGLEHSTYNNAREMAEWFTERKLVPMWSLDAERITRSLRPDFSSDKNIYVDFDLSNVRALQEDEDAKARRLWRAVGRPWMTVNEARSKSGMKPIEGGDDLAGSLSMPGKVAVEEDDPDELENENRQDGQKAALATYRRWALERVKAGKSLDGFDHPGIPLALSAAIAGALETVKTAGDVKAVFNSTWLGYP